MNGSNRRASAPGARSASPHAASDPITLADVRDTLDAEVVAGEHRLALELTTACGADLMSDVLTYSKPGALLLTGLTNPQVVRTAEMADIIAICFVRGKQPDEDTVKMAARQGLPLLKTRLPMFESCGRLYARGLIGVSESRE